MSVHVIDNLRQPVVPLGTSGDGVLEWARDWVIRIGGTLAFRDTTSTATSSRWAEALTDVQQTNSGLVASPATGTPSAAIAELRRRSGLTWDQLARLFSVARRSVHFWASGKAPNTAHEERLGRLLAVIRYIDRGHARATRAALMTASSDGVIPFDLLALDRFDEVMGRLGSGPGRSAPVGPPLSESARAARKPPPPDERVGALHDTVHREVGQSRLARTVKVNRTL